MRAELAGHPDPYAAPLGLALLAEAAGRAYHATLTDLTGG